MRLYHPTLNFCFSSIHSFNVLQLSLIRLHKYIGFNTIKKQIKLLYFSITLEEFGTLRWSEVKKNRLIAQAVSNY
jgi:hypothetical protein